MSLAGTRRKREGVAYDADDPFLSPTEQSQTQTLMTKSPSSSRIVKKGRSDNQPADETLTPPHPTTPTPAARSKFNPTPSTNSKEADDLNSPAYLCRMVELRLHNATRDLLSLHKYAQHHPDDHHVTLSWIDKNINDCANTLRGLQDLRRKHFRSYNTSAPHLQTLPASDTVRAQAAEARDRTRPKCPVVNAGTQTSTPCPLTPNLSYAEKARPPNLSHNELPPPAPCPPPEKHYPKARTVAPSNFDSLPIPQTNWKKRTTASAPPSKPKPACSRPSPTPLASQRLILQFVNRSIIKTLPDPQGLRDRINIALEGTNRLRGVNLTRGGNIVLHTLAPFTAVQLMKQDNPIWLTVRTQLNLTDADKPRFTLDRPWHRIVVHNVPIVDATMRIPVHEELLRWNEGITDTEIMGRRELCSLDALARRQVRAQEGRPVSTSYLLLLINGGAARRFVREGVFLYGSHCHVSVYEPKPGRR